MARDPDVGRQADQASAAAAQSRAAARRAVLRASRLATVTEVLLDEARELRTARSPTVLRPGPQGERHEMARLMLVRALAAVRRARTVRPGRETRTDRDR